jgi:hypothetical protein
VHIYAHGRYRGDHVRIRLNVEPSLAADEPLGVDDSGDYLVWLLNPTFATAALVGALMYNLASIGAVVPGRAEVTRDVEQAMALWIGTAPPPIPLPRPRMGSRVFR